MEKYEKGNELFKIGNYEEAIKEYIKSLEIIEENKKEENKLKLKIYLNLSICHLKLRNYEVYFSSFLFSLFPLFLKNLFIQLDM